MSDEDLTTEIETEDGKRWLSTDGKEYKSRSGAWKRSKKLLEQEETKVEDESLVKVSLPSFEIPNLFTLLLNQL